MISWIVPGLPTIVTFQVDKSHTGVQLLMWHALLYAALQQVPMQFIYLSFACLTFSSASLLPILCMSALSTGPPSIRELSTIMTRRHNETEMFCDGPLNFLQPLLNTWKILMAPIAQSCYSIVTYFEVEYPIKFWLLPNIFATPLEHVKIVMALLCSNVIVFKTHFEVEYPIKFLLLSNIHKVVAAHYFAAPT